MNTSLWKTQIAKVNIWNKEKFFNYLSSIGIDASKHIDARYCENSLVISVYLTLIQHSDVDGDLLPLFIPHGKGQKLLKDFELENVSYEEAKWTYEYYFKEADGNDDLKSFPEYKLFKIHTQFDNSNPKTYCQYLVNAATAKSNIGSATSDIWSLYGVVQMYQAFCKMKGTEQDSLYQKYMAPWFKISPSAPKNITTEMINQISYVYTRLVEEYVINAIKHMEGGSSHFRIYYLENMTVAENLKIVTEKLVKEFELSPKATHAFTDIVQWSKHFDVLSSVKSFITLYNKGKIVDFSLANKAELFDLIAQNTYFGNLVIELYQNKQKVSKAVSENFKYYEGVSIGKDVLDLVEESSSDDFMLSLLG